MENNLQFEQFPVRTIVQSDNEIWFVLKDVCAVLEISDDKQVYERLDDDEREGYKIPTPGGMQTMRCITEAGLYHVILRSNSEKAKPFRRWVTHEVLPTLRQQGYYSTLPDEELLKMLNKRLAEKPDFIRLANINKHNQHYLHKLKMTEELEELWKKRFDLTQEGYVRELSRICDDEISTLNKEWFKYVKWLKAYRMALNEFKHKGE